MDKILVAIFPSDARAYEGLRALEDLDGQGAITVYARTVIAVGEESGVTVKEGADEGPLGTPVALLTGSLLGPLAGSVGIAVAAGAGTLGRVLHDLARVGVDEDFLTEVGAALQPGTAAVIAEVWEERISPIDARVEALGGRTFRRVRQEIVDGNVQREIAAVRAELASLTAELATAPEGDQAHIRERIATTRAKLHDAQKRATAVLESLTRESEAKIAYLEVRAAEAGGEPRARLEARIAELRSQLRRRFERVGHAWVVAKEALA